MFQTKKMLLSTLQQKLEKYLNKYLKIYLKNYSGLSTYKLGIDTVEDLEK